MAEDDFVDGAQNVRRATVNLPLKYDKEDVQVAKALSLSEIEHARSRAATARQGASSILPTEEAFAEIARRASEMMLAWSDK